MGGIEGAATVTASFGVAVRFLSFVRAARAFEAVDGALRFLKTDAPAWRSAATAYPDMPLLRIPPETWTLVRNHLVADALNQAEADLVQQVIQRAIQDRAGFIDEYAPTRLVEAELEDFVMNTGWEAPDDFGQVFGPWSEAACDLVRHFGLAVDLRGFRPRHSVQGHNTDSSPSSAVFLKLPLADSSLDLECYTSYDLVGAMGCLALPSNLPPGASTAFIKLITLFALEPVDVRFQRARFKSPFQEKSEEDASPRLKLTEYGDDVEDGHFPSIPLNEVVPQWLIVGRLSAQM
ncbi:hypothetical protein NBRC10513_006611 [Rhodotorula toruloides]